MPTRTPELEISAPVGASFTTVAAPALSVITAVELATILGKSLASVRGDVSRAPHRLPPMVRIPGGGKTLWLVSTVEAWLKSHESGQKPPQPQPAAEPARRRRGRPTKAEQLASARKQVGGEA